MSVSTTRLYPLKFDLIYMSKIWGGDRIFPYKGHPSPSADIGESWEVSPMPGHLSVVSNGALKGKDIAELTREHGADFLGKHVRSNFGPDFPLLIKMIDANDDLSVQVHPNDEYALKHHNSRGKTEMWYLLDCTEDATIYAGWKKQTNPDELREIVKSTKVMDYLAAHHPIAGDVFYLPAGKVHTIGAGCLILEIQEASDVTYRMYDFDRVDDQGHKRALHIEESAAVVNYEVDPSGSSSYDREATDRLVPMVRSTYFETSNLRLTRNFELSIGSRDSFTMLFGVEGTVSLDIPGCESVLLSKGETVIIPACLEHCVISPLHGEAAHLIDCYVPEQ